MIYSYLTAAAVGLGLQLTTQGEGEIRVRATVAPDSVQIGQPFTLEISLTDVPDGAQIVFPALSDSGPVTVLGPPTVIGDGVGGVAGARYELAAWQVGNLVVPAGSLSVASDRAEVLIPLPDIAIRVTSVLPAEADPDTLSWRPPSDVFGRNWSLAEMLGGATLALALLLVSAAYLRRRGVSQPVPVVAGVEPRLRALEALSYLEQLGLAEGGELKAFYSTLSQIIREFIGDTRTEWGMDLTTSELRTSLTDGGLGSLEVETLGQVLDNSDSVKFARLRPNALQATLDLETAQKWIKEVEIERQEPELEASEEVAAEASEAAEDFPRVVPIEELFAQYDLENSESDEPEAEAP